MPSILEPVIATPASLRAYYFALWQAENIATVEARWDEAARLNEQKAEVCKRLELEQRADEAGVIAKP